jgi:excinuclease UvrABC nuclease subunit
LLNKFNALDDNKGKSGIYRWIHKIDKHSYIGRSIDLYVRFRNY